MDNARGVRGFGFQLFGPIPQVLVELVSGFHGFHVKQVTQRAWLAAERAHVGLPPPEPAILRSSLAP
jgi:hypothetical protein